MVKRIFIHKPVLKVSQDRHAQKEIDYRFIEQKYFTSHEESMKSFERLGIKTDDENDKV
jgi:hypothetical protein